MNGEADLAQDVLEREARAWSTLPAGDYEHAICGMMNDLAAASGATDGSAALLALVEEVLTRRGPTLAASRACAAERLLGLLEGAPAPERRARLDRLFLSAWQQLCLTVEAGPQSISLTPDLPPGVGLPYGTDPAAIGDPILRARAEQAAALHGVAIERWSAKQRALSSLHRLVRAVRRGAASSKEKDKLPSDLMAAMSRATGLPSELRQSLEGDAA